MYHTTGLSRDRIVDVCARVHSAIGQGDPATFPPILGLFNAVVVTLTYLRRNRVQAELAETYRVSQPTISRAISGLTDVIGRVLTADVPTAEDLHPDAITTSSMAPFHSALPCWSWAEHPELYSGKHHTTGLNVQVACSSRR